MNTYFPDLDIKQTYLSRDATWTYVTISLVGQSARVVCRGITAWRSM